MLQLAIRAQARTSLPFIARERHGCILRQGTKESQVSSHRVDEVGVAGKSAPWGAIEVTTGKPWRGVSQGAALTLALALCAPSIALALDPGKNIDQRSEEHTSELQSLRHLVCR